MNVKLHTVQDNTMKEVASRDMVTSERSLLTFDLTSFIRHIVGSTMQSIHLEIVISPHYLDGFFIWNTVDEEGPQLLVLSKKIPEAGIAEDTFFKRMKRSLSEILEDSSSSNALEDGFDKNVKKGKNNIEDFFRTKYSLFKQVEVLKLR